jgi:hypothetical protein
MSCPVKNRRFLKGATKIFDFCTPRLLAPLLACASRKKRKPVLSLRDCSKTEGFWKAQAKNLRFLKGGSKIEDFYAPFLAPTVRRRRTKIDDFCSEAHPFAVGEAKRFAFGEECKKQAYKNRRFL